MVKKNYKDTILTGVSTYHAWYAMFITKGKSEELWKYVDRLVIIPGSDPQDFPSIGIAKTSSTSLTLYISGVEVWLEKKEAYKIRFK